MIQGSQLDFESARSVSRRRFAKVAVAALAIIGFAGAGLSGALAHEDDGWDDDVFAPSGGFVASGGSGGSGGDDDVLFTGVGGSGGSGGSGWNDDWDDD
jgi:hypothetical protein